MLNRGKTNIELELMMKMLPLSTIKLVGQGVPCMEANIVKHLLNGTVALRLRWYYSIRDYQELQSSFAFASNI